MNQVKTFFQQYLSGYKPYKTYWNYEDGCVLKGCIDLYAATGDSLYRDFVLDYLSRYVAEDGSITESDGSIPRAMIPLIGSRVVMVLPKFKKLT